MIDEAVDMSAERPLDYFTELFKLKGWYILRDDETMDPDEYAFIVHDICPLGLHIRPEGSVMHYKMETCQQCGQSPPDEVLGLYKLYKWHDNDNMEVFDDGIVKQRKNQS